MKYLINGKEAELELADNIQIHQGSDRLEIRTPDGIEYALVVKKGDTTYVSFQGNTYEVKKVIPGASAAGHAGSGEAVAPMPGQIVDIHVSVGDEVKRGDKLLILEAMKMQQPIIADVDGTVAEIKVTIGDQVSDGQLLAKVEE